MSPDEISCIDLEDMLERGEDRVSQRGEEGTLVLGHWLQEEAASHIREGWATEAPTTSCSRSLASRGRATRDRRPRTTDAGGGVGAGRGAPGGGLEKGAQELARQMCLSQASVADAAFE